MRHCPTSAMGWSLTERVPVLCDMSGASEDLNFQEGLSDLVSEFPVEGNPVLAQAF